MLLSTYLKKLLKEMVTSDLWSSLQLRDFTQSHSFGGIVSLPPRQTHAHRLTDRPAWQLAGGSGNNWQRPRSTLSVWLSSHWLFSFPFLFTAEAASQLRIRGGLRQLLRKFQLWSFLGFLGFVVSLFFGFVSYCQNSN